MEVEKLRVYADTSVFGGCFDPEFEADSRKFFEEVRHGRFTVVISEVTIAELQMAPQEVKEVLANLPPENVEFVERTDEADSLTRGYLEAGIVGAGLQMTLLT